MPLLQADNLEKFYGADLVFRQVSFSLDAGHRVGLVGPNGHGKTTLLRIILGEEDYNGGDFRCRGALEIGYLPQIAPEFDSDKTVWGFCREVFSRFFEIEARLAHLAERMAEPDCPDWVMHDYEQLQHEFEVNGGYRYETRLHTVLAGLGFAPEQHEQPLAELSGGWRTRAYLARLLLEEPELLMLDEPTNHLDLDATRWLEDFLQSWRGSLLVVSHDRFLLDRITDRIWELAGGFLENYKGCYSDYLTQRAQRFDERLKQYEKQQEYIRETEEFVRRHIAGQRTKEAQGRRKRLARFIEREAVPQPRRMRGIKVKFAPVKRAGDIVMRTANLAIGYDGQVLLETPDFELQRGQRLAVIGGNGTGKSTFLRTLTGELPAVAGTCRFGANVTVGYLSQEHENLDPDLTLVDAIREVQQERSDGAARNLLGSLLFSGDDVFKRVGDLSGGERSRLALARLGLIGANLLLLDEPTNHLDIPSQEVLQSMLADYPGTLVFVSHDRFLIRGLATRLLVLGDNTAELVHGDWEYYQRQSAEAEAGTDETGESTKRTDYRKEKRRQNALRRLERRHRELEEEIHQAEQEKGLLEYAISKAGEAQDVEEVHRLGEEFTALERQLAALWEEWAKVDEQLADG